MTRLLLTLALVAASSGAPAARTEWTRVDGGDVVVFGTGPPRTLREIAAALARFRSVVAPLVGGPEKPAGLPTFVYVFDSPAAMRPFVPLHEGRPLEIAGYCHCGADPRGSFIVLGPGEWDDLARIVLHEYTHLVVSASSPALPSWLGEGLAEYFSTFRTAARGTRAEIGAPPGNHLERLRTRLVPVRELVADEQSAAGHGNSERRTAFYATAWALTHYLLTQHPRGRDAVAGYVRAIAGGTPRHDAFARHVGDAGQLDAALREYVRRRRFRPAMIPLSSDGASSARASRVPQAEIDARLGLVQLRIGRGDEAAERIEAAAADPPGAAAQLALGVLRLQQRRREEAWEAFERAAALAPDEFAIQHAVAEELRWAVHPLAGPPAPPAAQRTAEAAAARAAALDPDSPDAQGLHALFEWRVNARLDAAAAAIERAIARAPARLEYQLWRAGIAADQGDLPRARQLLTALAVAHADDPAGQRARQMLAHMGEARELAAEFVDALRAR